MQLGETLLEEGENGEAVFKSNRGNGYSVIPRGYLPGILASDRRSLIRHPLPKPFKDFRQSEVLLPTAENI